MGNLVSTK